MKKEKIALVTGGNRGIGLAICRQLALRGDVRVLMGSRDVAKGEQAVAQLAMEGVANVTVCALDVSDEASIAACFERIEAEFGRLDILVNNAGVYLEKGRSLLEVDFALFEKTLAVNALAPLRLVQVFLPLLKVNDWGRIVNVTSSMSREEGLGNGSAGYRFSKMLLNHITRVLADDLRGTGIKLNAMRPGWVRSEMGGTGAPRTLDEGADTAVWLATLPDDGPHGGFFYDRKAIEL